MGVTFFPRADFVRMGVQCVSALFLIGGYMTVQSVRNGGMNGGGIVAPPQDDRAVAACIDGVCKVGEETSKRISSELDAPYLHPVATAVAYVAREVLREAVLTRDGNGLVTRPITPS